jgi:D-threonate/D-erythronate kinase
VDLATDACGVRKVRLVADDLTGALDTAAQFAGGPTAPIVAWSAATQQRDAFCVAVDSGCRDMPADAAAPRFERFIDVLSPHGDRLSVLKIDSLLRGHAASEIALCARRWPDRAIIVAPAFPQQGRVTRGGRQYVLADGAARVVGEDIGATLRAHGIAVALRRPGADAPSGISIWDADCDDGLTQVVHAGRRLDHAPLWCGSAGLGAALSRLWPAVERHNLLIPARPLLGIFGSDHPVTQQQLARVAPVIVAIAETGDSHAVALHRTVQQCGVAFATFALPTGVARDDARRSIDARLPALLARLPRPASLLVSGGETLRSVCQCLRADGLRLEGEVAAGIPLSTIVGGSWSGVQVISKSGAFGAPDFLANLVRAVTRSDVKEQS